jgi:hypothetical protein
MLACVGIKFPAPQARDYRSEISCFLEAPEDEYYEYLWQLSELVIARGLDTMTSCEQHG